MALQDRWPPKAVTVNDRVYCIIVFKLSLEYCKLSVYFSLFNHNLNQLSLLLLAFSFIDEPVNASNLARHKDGFEDILEERRHNSDFKYCIRTRTDIPSYKYCKPRTPEEIKEHVTNSDRVKYRVEMVK